MRASAVWLISAGLLTTTRAIVEQFEPAYWSPTTPLDYLAAGLTTTMWLAFGIGLLAYWRSAPIRRGATLVFLGAVGVTVAAMGNLLEDVFGVSVATWLFLVGILVAALALVVGGTMTLSVRGSHRWVGLFLILWVVGGVAPDNWGEFVSGFSAFGLGLWLLTLSRETARPEGEAHIAGSGDLQQ